MSCETEKKAYEDAKKVVQGLRQDLKDYTGSDKPGGGVPSGGHAEGTQAGNEEVERIREALQQALEHLSATRVALSRCREQSVD